MPDEERERQKWAYAAHQADKQREITQAAIERSHAPCEQCGHPHSEHREHAPTFKIEGGEIVTVEHPDYQPGLFICGRENCNCEVRPSAR